MVVVLNEFIHIQTSNTAWHIVVDIYMFAMTSKKKNAAVVVFIVIKMIFISGWKG